MKSIFDKKFSTVILFLTILVLISYSCENDKDNDPIIDYEYTSNEIIYYPDKHISIVFDLKPRYDLGNYTINWYNPDSLTGKGPFKIIISNNAVLDFEISDEKNNVKRFQHEVKAENDSVKYDYRNDYTGTYSCYVTHSNNGILNYYQDTLTVVKNNAFNMMNILTKHDIENNFVGNMMIYHNSNGFNNSPTGSFFGYHAGASFANDSIHYIVSGPLGYYYSDSYVGVKMVK